MNAARSKNSFASSRWPSWPLAGVLLASGVACGGKASDSGQANSAGGDPSLTAGSGGAPASDGVAGASTGATNTAGATADGGRLEAGGSTDSEAGTGNEAGDPSEAGNAGEAGDPDTPNAEPRSCAMLAPTCGPARNADCCAASTVTGGSFVRRANGQDFPAAVSDFSLDQYEITVGRFRNFVAAYSPSMIPSGAGKNPNNPADAGWNSAWNAALDASPEALKAALKCGALYDNDPYQTWTDSAGSAELESLPITCLDWFEAEAFCIWDGGRLPTDAEWMYAASGGAEQRAYPWGNSAPDCAHANFFGSAGGTDYCVNPGVGSSNAVGSESPLGDGKWGQADLAGNVNEWVQDWARAYPAACNDCATLSPSTRRVVKGGGYGENAGSIENGFRESAPPTVNIFGARCARKKPRKRRKQREAAPARGHARPTYKCCTSSSSSSAARNASTSVRASPSRLTGFFAIQI